jgi:hypothetical protein
VWLNFGNEEIAKRVKDKFSNGSYTLHGRKVVCDRPNRGAGKRNPHAWTVLMKDLAATISEKDIDHAIFEYRDKPRHIEMGKPSYDMSSNEVSARIKRLFSQVGALDAWEVTEDSSARRVKAIARFQYEADAREAAQRLNDKSLSFLNNGKILAQVIISAKFKIATNVYDIVKPVLSVVLRA